MKIRPVGAELFRTEGRTDMTKLIVALRVFENASKTELHIISIYICRPFCRIKNGDKYRYASVNEEDTFCEMRR